MRRTLVLIFAVAISIAAPVARGDDSIQGLGRYWGFGWGDGYHSQRTWPLGSGPSCNCGPAVRQAPTPAAAPKQMQPQKAEPTSPSDRPAAKTSMRRYPKKSG